MSIFWSGDLPFLLCEAGSTTTQTEEDVREQKAYGILGGYCCVHGLADGEGVEMAERQAIPPSEICLI